MHQQEEDGGHLHVVRVALEHLGQPLHTQRGKYLENGPESVSQSLVLKFKVLV